MSDNSETGKPGLPAVAARAPESAPRAALRISFGPSAELIEFLKENPGGKLTIRFPGDPGYGESRSDVRGPAFSMRSWREDNHVCSHCSQPFSVAYGNPPEQTSATHNIAVRCPACHGVVAVPFSADIIEEAIVVQAGPTSVVER